MADKYSILNFKRGDKVWVDIVGSNKIPCVFIKYDGTTAIVREVGKINSQGYSYSRPFGINSSLVSKRNTKVLMRRKLARRTIIGANEKLMKREWS